jgi:hypothetical protein
VHRAEILALLQGTPGVERVTDLVLLLGEDRRELCGDAALCPSDLVAAGPHELAAVRARTKP